LSPYKKKGKKGIKKKNRKKAEISKISRTLPCRIVVLQKGGGGRKEILKKN